MEGNTNQNKDVKNLGPLTLELVEKLCGDGPSYQDYIDGLSQEELDKHTSQYMDTKDSFTLGLGDKKHKVLDFDWLDLSLTQVKALTDDELQKLLSGEGHKGGIRDSTIQLISNEVLIRQIRESSKPHWTTVPAFYLLCISILFSVVSLGVAIYALNSNNSNSNNNHTYQGDSVKPNSKPQ